jgi:hypothetical protein
MSEFVLLETDTPILYSGVLGVTQYVYHRENGREQLSDFELAAVVSVLGPFELELDAQFFRPTRRSFPFGFHLERRLRRRIECHGVATCLKGDRVTGVELIDDRLEVRRDLFSAHALFRFEENFLWHTASEYVPRVVKRR